MIDAQTTETNMTDTIAIHTFPAYTVVELKPSENDEPICIVDAEKTVRVLMGTFRDGSPRFDQFSFGSIVSCAKKYSECPIAAIDRCRQQMIDHPHAGHKLHWVNSCAVVVSDTHGAHEHYVGLHLNDVVTFEGVNFRLVSAPNSNIALVRV